MIDVHSSSCISPTAVETHKAILMVPDSSGLSCLACEIATKSQPWPCVTVTVLL